MKTNSQARAFYEAHRDEIESRKTCIEFIKAKKVAVDFWSMTAEVTRFVFPDHSTITIPWHDDLKIEVDDSDYYERPIDIRI